jgi:restriction endonuclease S subunit
MNVVLKKYKLGDFLNRVKNGLNLEDNVNYKRVTIRIYNKGIFVRDELLGKKIKTKRQFIISEGQFLMSKIDARNGAFGIVPIDLNNGIITGNFWAFDVDKNIISAEFFRNFTLAPNFIQICKKASTGSTNRKYLNEAKFLNIEISIPDIEEQRNILKKIDSIRVTHKELVNEIQSQQENLVKLRQSILQDAVLGRLTEDWRFKNPNIEPASELLKKIKIEKKQLIKEKKIKKEKMSPQIEKEEIPFEIPKSWEWCRMQNISEKLGAGSTPKGGSSVYVSEGIMFFRSQNIYNKRLRLNNVAFISNEIHDKMKGTKVRAKDILLNITGGSIGRSTLISDDFKTANVSQHVAIVRMIELETRQFIRNLIISPYFQARIMDVQVGVSREGLSMTSLKDLLVPLPPLEEQKVIVEKTNQLLVNCDVLEQEIIKSKLNSEKLMQSVLSELLGEENNFLIKKTPIENIKEIPLRKIKYNNETLLMDLVILLKENGKLYAEDLWKMSKHPDDIDAFYAELKEQIEKEKTIKESEEKGYLELV